MTTSQPLSPDIDQIAGHIGLLGLPIEVVDLSGGKKGIRATTSGIPFSAFLFTNEEQKSSYLMLSAMFPDRKVTSDWANVWNNRFPLTRASVAENGEPMLTHSMILTGVDTDHLKEVVSWWDLLLKIFVEEILAASP